MISLSDLLDKIDFQPKSIYLQDGEKEIRIDYQLLEEETGYPLNCFLELTSVDGKVFYINHPWEGTTDLYCDSSILKLLKRIDEEQNGLHNQQLSKYLLMVQDALKDLRAGDETGIIELVSLIEASKEF